MCRASPRAIAARDRRGSPRLFAASATQRKPATQKLPAACPLGKDGSCGAPMGDGSASAIQGRTRPKASFRLHTRTACTTMAAASGRAAVRVARVPQERDEGQDRPPAAEQRERDHQRMQSTVLASIEGPEHALVDAGQGCFRLAYAPARGLPPRRHVPLNAQTPARKGRTRPRIHPEPARRGRPRRPSPRRRSRQARRTRAVETGPSRRPRPPRSLRRRGPSASRSPRPLAGEVGRR